MALHVPAWKRLGLRLKYSNDDATAVMNNSQNEKTPMQSEDLPAVEHQENKRKRDESASHHTDSAVHQAKKARTSTRPQQQEHSTRSSGQDKPEVPEDNINTNLKRKKSVSFAADTKAEDGDTAQTIQFVTPNSPGSTPPRPRREKTKKKGSTTHAPVPLTSKKSRDALEYLSRHYTTRTSWKFNKNREVWVLKHVLSTTDLPADYNAALSNYLYNLKSTGARARLAEECQKSLSAASHESTGDDEDRPRHLAAFISQLGDDSLAQRADESEEYSSWIKAQHRPEIVLWSLGEPTDTVSESVLGKKMPSRQQRSTQRNGTSTTTALSAISHGNGVGTKRVKKSKARTSRAGLESDTSSSGSSSDSSSDSSLDSDSESEDVGKDQKNIQSKGFAITVRSDSTSSDSSDLTSNSSSDASSDEDDSSE